jgi:hypothetical protein
MGVDGEYESNNNQPFGKNAWEQLEAGKRSRCDPKSLLRCAGTTPRARCNWCQGHKDWADIEDGAITTDDDRNG